MRPAVALSSLGRALERVPTSGNYSASGMNRTFIKAKLTARHMFSNGLKTCRIRSVPRGATRAFGRCGDGSKERK